MSRIRLSRKQVAVVSAIRTASGMLKQKGFLSSDHATAICRWYFPRAPSASRALALIESAKPRLLSRVVGEDRYISRQAPKWKDVNQSTPGADQISFGELRVMIGLGKTSVVKN